MTPYYRVTTTENGAFLYFRTLESARDFIRRAGHNGLACKLERVMIDPFKMLTEKGAIKP